MSGVYNNWIKVNYPNMSNDIPQMKDGGEQAPFYFGGSQVPEAFGIKTVNEKKMKMKGKGFRGDIEPFKPEDIKQGKARQITCVDRSCNIHKPRRIYY